MNPITDIHEAIALLGGRAEITKALGITLQAVGNWVWREKISSRQAIRVLRLAKSKGVLLHDSLFEAVPLDCP